MSSDTQTVERDEQVVAVGLAGLLSCRLRLTPVDVHLWLARLDHRLASDKKYLLSDDEEARAARFHFEKDRNDFIAARVLLRTLLAVYVDIESDKLQFSYGEKGKPYLKEGPANGIKFNLAHSHGRALYAFASGREVGVDLEFMREELADEQVAQRFFSATEIHSLRAVPAELRKEAFFNCWTRKEAYIKALGEGLSMPLDEFDVSLTPGEPAALLRNHKMPADAARWTMRAVPMTDGFVATLVVEGHDWQQRTFRLD